jgi:hypothetical protein
MNEPSKELLGEMLLGLMPLVGGIYFADTCIYAPLHQAAFHEVTSVGYSSKGVFLACLLTGIGLAMLLKRLTKWAVILGFVGFIAAFVMPYVMDAMLRQYGYGH